MAGRDKREESALFSLLKRKRLPTAYSGIAMQKDGVALAQVSRSGGTGEPQLQRARFRATPSASARPTTLQRLAVEYDLAKSYCVSLLEPRQYALLLVDTPDVDESEMRNAVRWRVKDLIDFPVDEAVVDVFHIPGQVERGRHRMSYVVAARTESTREHIELMEESGVALAVVDIPELAQRNVAALLPEDQEGVAMLSLRAGRGLLTLTRRGDLYLARALDRGMQDIRRYLAAEPQSQQSNESDELSLVPADDEYELSPGLRRVLDAIVLEVQRSLDYYESHFALPPVSGVVLAPTGEEVPGMVGYIANSLGVPVRVLDLNAVLNPDAYLSDKEQAKCLGAIGAALRLAEEAG